MKEQFEQEIQSAYDFEIPSLLLGAAILDDAAIAGLQVKAPLKMMNRHGLIAGATGTGKTKTVQMLAENLSRQGVPSIVMDLKGDLSGLATAGESNAAIDDRQNKIGQAFEGMAFPVEFLTLSTAPGVQVRSTLTEFGPMLLSKMLNLNDNQSSLIAIIYKYSLDNDLPLIDLNDLKSFLSFFESDQRKQIEKEYGRIATASISTIRRKVLELEQQGAGLFFGEPSLNVSDLMQVTPQGLATISILSLSDIQDRPKLFSSFMLALLSEIYSTFPEMGDMDKPKLVLFIDEAHLLFENANQALLEKIENIVKLIRSKGVGLFFCTQSPDDIPNTVLGQLGMKVQHALRAFTAKDRKAIKLAAQNYPDSEYYNTATLLTSLGIGEAAITVLDKKGRPTPLVATLLQAPRSSMSAISENEKNRCIKHSANTLKYQTRLDRDSAHEKLQNTLNEPDNETKSTPKKDKIKKEADSMLESLSKNTLVRQIIRTIFKELMRLLTGKR